jgi:peptidyl-prolyl cis-trans isomerase C
MEILKTLVLMTVAIAFAMGCGGSTKSGKVLVEINGDKITEGNLELLGEINPRIQRQLERPDGRKKILENLVEQDLLYQAAMKEGLNRDPEVKAKADLYRQMIIGQALVDEQIDKAAKEYYDKYPIEFQKLELAQIDIKFGTAEHIKKAAEKGKKLHTEKEALKIANEVKAKIAGGMSFEEAAKKYSEDPTARASGGNMGLVSMRDRMLKARGFEPVLEKAFSMKVGEVAGPIKSTFGYHIITVTRGARLEPFDEAKQSIFSRLKLSERKRLIIKLKRDAKIVYPQEEKKAEEGAAEVKGAAEKAAKAPAETTEKK